MALSTPAQKEEARLKKQQRWNEDRAYLRQNDDDFIEREKASTKKYNNFKKMAVQFARARAADFASFLSGKDMAGAPSSAAPLLPAHVLSPAPAPDEPFEFPPDEKPDVYSSLGSHTPTASYLERRRLQLKPDNVLTQIGIDMR
jgi:hypothetical protein